MKKFSILLLSSWVLVGSSTLLAATLGGRSSKRGVEFEQTLAAIEALRKNYACISPYADCSMKEGDRLAGLGIMQCCYDSTGLYRCIPKAKRSDGAWHESDDGNCLPLL